MNTETRKDTILFVDSNAAIRRVVGRYVPNVLKYGLYFGIYRPTPQVLEKLEEIHARVLAVITDLSFEASGERLPDEEEPHIGLRLASRASELGVPNVALYTGDREENIDLRFEVIKKPDSIEAFLIKIGAIVHPPEKKAAGQ